MITYQDFEKVDIRVGKTLKVEDFPQAHKPAYILEIDFGPEIGIKKSSAQLTTNYTKEDIIGRLVIAVINFPIKRIGHFPSLIRLRPKSGPLPSYEVAELLNLQTIRETARKRR